MTATTTLFYPRNRKVNHHLPHTQLGYTLRFQLILIRQKYTLPECSHQPPNNKHLYFIDGSQCVSSTHQPCETRNTEQSMLLVNTPEDWQRHWGCPYISDQSVADSLQLNLFGKNNNNFLECKGSETDHWCWTELQGTHLLFELLDTHLLLWVYGINW